MCFTTVDEYFCIARVETLVLLSGLSFIEIAK